MSTPRLRAVVPSFQSGDLTNTTVTSPTAALDRCGSIQPPHHACRRLIEPPLRVDLPSEHLRVLALCRILISGPPLPRRDLNDTPNISPLFVVAS